MVIQEDEAMPNDPELTRIKNCIVHYLKSHEGSRFKPYEMIIDMDKLGKYGDIRIKWKRYYRLLRHLVRDKRINWEKNGYYSWSRK